MGDGGAPHVDVLKRAGSLQVWGGRGMLWEGDVIWHDLSRFTHCIPLLFVFVFFFLFFFCVSFCVSVCEYLFIFSLSSLVWSDGWRRIWIGWDIVLYLSET